MRLRPPAYPLVTVDPYFSVWSRTEALNASHTMHWTNHTMRMTGEVIVGGVPFRFMGLNDVQPIPQTSVNVDAFTTAYTFENDLVHLDVRFFTPLTPDDLDRMTRPVSYLQIIASPKIDAEVRTKITVSDEICLNEGGESSVTIRKQTIDQIPAITMGNLNQKVLNRSGDDIRIDWGYFTLAVFSGDASVRHDRMEGMSAVSGFGAQNALFLLAYDDVDSMVYFGKNLKSVWNQGGKTIEGAIADAIRDYRCGLPTYLDERATELFARATRAGGEKYAELLELAYRQAIAAHKCVVDENGQILFVSKECYSNGCGATVDVSYPSIPLFLLENPELVKGMMRPIYAYARTEEWKNEPYAPHDCGQYPILNGQVYGMEGDVYNPPVRKAGVDRRYQMPVEECGNMLVMAAAVSIAEDDVAFVEENFDLLTTWAEYLLQYGLDPENQLCTDDFAGHLAHNCNLSIKAIMGLASYSILCAMLDKPDQAEKYDLTARDLAKKWCEMASNGDGSYRLAFDREGTFSMKYNAVWDKLFGTNLFPPEVLQSEVQSNFRRMNPYGMPLDNRSDYTKSDWMVWTATILNEREDFERYIEPLWNAYHRSASRVPMTDWFYTSTAAQVGFQNRTVQGGLFIKLLEQSGMMRIF